MTEQRKRVVIPVEFEASGQSGHGKVKNVSLGGLFVDTALIPQQGDTIRLRMSPNGKTLDVTGMVWWTTREQKSAKRMQGFGLRVLGEDERYRAFVEKQLDGKQAAIARVELLKRIAQTGKR
jgi:Tfp pilus assembly protein PilZ